MVIIEILVSKFFDFCQLSVIEIDIEFDWKGNTRPRRKFFVSWKLKNIFNMSNLSISIINEEQFDVFWRSETDDFSTIRTAKEITNTSTTKLCFR